MLNEIASRLNRDKVAKLNKCKTYDLALFYVYAWMRRDDMDFPQFKLYLRYIDELFGVGT